MPTPPTDEAHEQRITYEIVVDCYDEYEVVAGWYCYLDDRLDYPFQAKWSPPGTSKSETVQVVAMASEDECQSDILVEIERQDDEMTVISTVPLTEIEPLENQPERTTAIEDWQYWRAQGCQLIDPNEYEEY